MADDGISRDLKQNAAEDRRNEILQLAASGAREEAWTACKLALTQHPDSPELLVGVATLLMDLDQAAEAERYMAKAAVLRPDSAVIWNNLGLALRHQNRIPESVRCFESALALDRNWARPHFELASSLLLSGDYRRGFAEFEHRWSAHGLKRPGDSEPEMFRRLWRGEDPGGKRVLVYAEQGLGDTVQFARYVAPLQARGAEVVLEVQPVLRDLLRWLRPACRIGQGDGLATFDLHCPLMTLPMIFGTTLETVPQPAEFSLPEEIEAEWKAKIPVGDRLNIGLVWAGNPENPMDKRRSTHLESLEPLLGDRNLRQEARFFSFQVGSRQHEAGSAGFADVVSDLRPQLSSATETAAALLQMDLVIAVDTFVAHLAASLGITVWLLLSFTPDWRWLLTREDSPWYPSMRLFRQSVAGDWAGVAEGVREALRSLTDRDAGPIVRNLAIDQNRRSVHHARKLSSAKGADARR